MQSVRVIRQRETKPVGSSANGQTAGPPSVAGTAESGERVDLDCVLKGRSLPAVRQTHPHLQVHLQRGKRRDLEDGISHTSNCLNNKFEEAA